MTFVVKNHGLLLGLFAAACANAPAAASMRCENLLHMHVPAQAIGLPTAGAIVDAAVPVAAGEDFSPNCRINGHILASSRGAPDIRFQINLPDTWNGKALQFGGGGLDGKLIDGLHDMPGNAPISSPPPNPLARGFVTFGSDAGHQASDPFDGSFGQNGEARENYAGAAVKKVHDTAIAVIRSFYHQAPKRVYFAGGSKGGHEGLVAAQRYGADYDGVIIFYPAKDSVALIFGWAALTQAAYGPVEGALTPAKQQFLHRAILAACDKLDGVEDGIVANVRACEASISPTSLQCAPGGQSSDTCLATGEIALLETGERRLDLPFTLANGVSSIGPFPIMADAPLDRILMSPDGRGATVYDGFVRAIIRNFWTHDTATTIETLDTARFRDAILAYSRQADATSPDIDAFVRHGGKMIIVQGSDDMLVPPSATTDYFTKLAARYGEKTPQIARYFIQPGYSHGFGVFNLSWDSLSALDSWVETDKFPADPVATDGNPATRDRQMPLCEYPLFPRFQSSDPKSATSFRCSAN